MRLGGGGRGIRLGDWEEGRLRGLGGGEYRNSINFRPWFNFR